MKAARERLARALVAVLLVPGGAAEAADATACLPGARVIHRDSVEQCVTPDGKLHGLVRVRSRGGKVVVEQHWRNDVLDGPARAWHDNGRLESEGSYRAGKPDGTWKEWWPSGTLAGETRYRAGERTGIWTLYYPDGKPAWRRVYGPGGKLSAESTFDEGGRPADKELPRAVVARVMHGARPALRLCYEAELGTDPGLRGQLRVDFEIGPSGAVHGQELVESTLHNQRVEQCVLKNLARVEFPRPHDGEPVAVSFPFSFRGEGADLPPPDEEE